MCKESKTKTESVSEVPEYVTEGSKLLLNKSKDLSSREFQPYTGDRVANLTDQQKGVFQLLNTQQANYPGIQDEALGNIRKSADAPAQTVGTERVVDEGGRLGGIQDYLNPYTGGVLDDTIKRIQDAADRQRVQIGKAAIGSGAYNDARHGVAGSLSREDELRTVGETSGNILRNAYNDAMGLRTGDLNRFLGADTTSANFAETALGRARAGAGDLQQQQTQQLNNLGSMLGLGEMERTITQAELDSAYEVYLREYADSYDSVAALSAALSGLPFTRSRTTTSTKPDNSGLALAGSLAGAAAGSFVGMPTLGASLGGSLGGALGGGGGPGGAPAMPAGAQTPWGSTYR